MWLRPTVMAIFLSGCTVPVGSVPDAAPCAPSPKFFASDVWSGYVEPNQCATPGCHGFSDGHGYLRYRPPGGAIDPTLALADWPEAWRDNYYQSIQLVNCAQPLASRLLSVPEGKADPHPPGPSVAIPQQAEQLFQDWVTAQ